LQSGVGFSDQRPGSYQISRVSRLGMRQYLRLPVLLLCVLANRPEVFLIDILPDCHRRT
jgi:hypothetical protein